MGGHAGYLGKQKMEGKSARLRYRTFLEMKYSPPVGYSYDKGSSKESPIRCAVRPGSILRAVLSSKLNISLALTRYANSTAA